MEPSSLLGGCGGSRSRDARHPVSATLDGESESPDSITGLTRRICAFRDARDWMQFHNPKEMAVAISAEAGELLQHFVWQSPAQSQERLSKRRDAVASEMADIAILLFEMAENSGISLPEAIDAKLRLNESRYPADKARGSNQKYTEL